MESAPAQTYYQRNRESILKYKREYYHSHPEFKERKRKSALERYYAKKAGKQENTV